MRENTWPDKIQYQVDMDGTVVKYLERKSGIVGNAANEVVNVCENYDIPIGQQRFRVLAMEPVDHRVRGGVMPISYDKIEIGFRDGGRTWELSQTPDGYAIVIRNTTDYNYNQTVRHEMAHACCWEEDGYTHESTGNHAEWCRKLDCERTMY